MTKGGKSMAKARHKQEQGKDVVEITDLKVLVNGSDDEGWMAQGLEIDYFICAKAEKSVKEKFIEGLSKTIALHITENGNIENLLIPAPPQVWKEYYEASNKAAQATASIRVEGQTLPDIHKTHENTKMYLPKNLTFVTTQPAAHRG